jgi:RNA polymerase sigma factor (sigma-70 family)
VHRAVAGDRDALGSVLESLRDPLYRLATGMFWDRADAEDATQDALIAVMTSLSSFRGDAALSTWAYRIAVRLFARRRRSTLERAGLTWDVFADDLQHGLSDERSSQPDAELLAEEVRVGCTLAVLQCLDRGERLVYLLGDVFGLPGDLAAEVVGTTHDAYRQRLGRVRSKVRAAVERHCGIVNEHATCRCSRRIERAVQTRRVDPGRLRFVRRTDDVRASVEQMQQLHDVTALFRSAGRFATPEDARPAVAELLAIATDAGLTS